MGGIKATEGSSRPPGSARFRVNHNALGCPTLLAQAVKLSWPSGIRKNPETRENELLEAKLHERLDTGTPGAAIGADRAVETVGALNRS